MHGLMTNSCMCVLMMWSDCGWSLGEGEIFIIAKDRKLRVLSSSFVVNLV